MNEHMQLLSEIRAAHIIQALGDITDIGIPVFCDDRPVPGFPYIRESVYYWEGWKDTPWGKAKVTHWTGALEELAPFLVLQNPQDPPPITIPRVGYATWDIASATVTVYDDTGPVYYTYQEAGTGDVYRLHTHLLCELAEKQIPVYPEKLYGFFSRPFPYPINKICGVRIPYVSNNQVRCPVVGFALYQSGLVYLHAVAHKSTLLSIRATVHQGKRLTIANGANSYLAITDSTYKSFITPVGFNVHRMILVDIRALDNADPAFLISPTEISGPVFATKLDSLVLIPILQEWGDLLLRRGKERGLVRELIAGGDVRGGIVIRSDTEAWAELVGNLLRERQLAI